MKKGYDSVELLKKLVRKGKKTGKISFSEVTAEIDKLNISKEQIELFYQELFQKCSEANIKLIEDNEDYNEELIEEASYREISSNDYELGISIYLREMGKIPMLTPEEEKELTIKLAEGTKEEADKARKKLIEANLRLVVSMAKRYARRMNVPLMDIIQEGNMGLIHATERFDYKLGVKFSTYAVYWIKQSIIRNTTETSRSIRFPAGVHEKISKLKKVSSKLAAEKGRPPTPEELAECMKISVSEVKKLTLYNQDIISLYNPVGEEDDGDCLIDFIADESSSNSHENTISQFMVRDILNDAKRYLSENELIVVKRRYGIDTGNCETLDQIAKTIDNGITRERVRQIEEKAIRKIKKNMKKKYQNERKDI